jgi:hypothetical protein
MNAAESMSRHGQTQASFGFQTNGAPIPWAEVCRHPNFPRRHKQSDGTRPTNKRAVPVLVLCLSSTLLMHLGLCCILLQIFSRHEAILASHLEMLDAVKSQIAPNGEAFRTVSSMVTKTMQAINQSKVARKQMVGELVRVLF